MPRRVQALAVRLAAFIALKCSTLCAGLAFSAPANFDQVERLAMAHGRSLVKLNN